MNTTVDATQHSGFVWVFTEFTFENYNLMKTKEAEHAIPPQRIHEPYDELI